MLISSRLGRKMVWGASEMLAWNFERQPDSLRIWVGIMLIPSSLEREPLATAIEILN
jgi:hypothetical protein